MRFYLRMLVCLYLLICGISEVSVFGHYSSKRSTGDFTLTAPKSVSGKTSPARKNAYKENFFVVVLCIEENEPGSQYSCGQIWVYRYELALDVSVGANGNVSALHDLADGAQVASYEYDPFGNLVAETGGGNVRNPWKFSTKYLDESGLYYYGYRFYDPAVGRWVNRDPIGEEGGENLYGFVGNSTNNFNDFNGLNILPAGLNQYSQYFKQASGWTAASQYGVPHSEYIKTFNQMPESIVKQEEQFLSGYVGLSLVVMSGGALAELPAAEYSLLLAYNTATNIAYNPWVQAGVGSILIGAIEANNCNDPCSGITTASTVFIFHVPYLPWKPNYGVVPYTGGGGSWTKDGIEIIPPNAPYPRPIVNVTPKQSFLPIAPTTTLTLNQVRRLPPQLKGFGGEQYVRELLSGNPERYYPIPHTGGRYVDVPVDVPSGVIGVEVKNFGQWTTVSGCPTQKTVPLNPHIQSQILKDVFLRQNVQGYDPRWIFLNAKPSPQLTTELNNHQIIFIIYE